jgi:lipoprotein-releasing system permease protein
MSHLSWIAFVAKRWFSARKESGAGLSSKLAAAGIAVGVAALVVVLGVMNGFQLGFIDSILDISSFHLRVEVETLFANTEKPDFDAKLAESLAAVPGVVSVAPFAETRCLLAGNSGRGYPAVIRALPSDIEKRDPVMMRALNLLQGGFPPKGGGLIIGAELSRSLGLQVGSLARLTIVKAGGEEGAEAEELRIPVAGVFRSGYYDFDSGMALIPFEDAGRLFPSDRPITFTYGVKLSDRYADSIAVERIRSTLGLDAHAVQAWRDYNRAFFGALRTEKTIMMLLIGLIFLVVGSKFFIRCGAPSPNAPRTSRFSRRSEPRGIDSTRFVADGLAVGVLGALGLSAGLFIAANVNEILAFIDTAARFLTSLFENFSNRDKDYRLFSPQYFYLVEVPVRVLFPETFFIVAAAIGSSAAAAGAASSKAIGLAPSEVLHYE